MRRKRSELVAMRAEGKSRQFGNLLSSTFRKFRMSVQPSPDSSSADGKIVKSLEHLLQPLNVAVEQTRPAAELLPERQRHSILQMSASDLDDIMEFPSLGCDRIMHALDRRNQRVLHAIRRRNMHRRRKRVVRRLRHVHVVIRMNGFLRSHLAARNLNSAIRDHFIDIHIGLRAAARLPDAQRELVLQLAGNHFVGSLHDQLRLVCRQLAQVLVHQRARLLEDAESANEFRRHGVAPNVEVQQRALRLRAPVDIGRDLDLSHAVGFHARTSRPVAGSCHRHPDKSAMNEVTGNYSAEQASTLVLTHINLAVRSPLGPRARIIGFCPCLAGRCTVSRSPCLIFYPPRKLKFSPKRSFSRIPRRAPTYWSLEPGPLASPAPSKRKSSASRSSSSTKAVW